MGRYLTETLFDRTETVTGFRVITRSGDDILGQTFATQLDAEAAIKDLEREDAEELASLQAATGRNIGRCDNCGQWQPLHAAHDMSGIAGRVCRDCARGDYLSFA